MRNKVVEVSTFVFQQRGVRYGLAPTPHLKRFASRQILLPWEMMLRCMSERF